MAHISPPERRADQRYVTLILRLLVDHQRRLVLSEVGGLSQDAACWMRFRGADGLLGAVQAWLAGAADHTEHPG